MNTQVAPIHWSYSSLKSFEGCPQRYYMERETGQIKPVQGEQMLYGQALHEAVENHVKHGTPIPDQFAAVKPVVASLLRVPGDKYSELDLSLRADFSPCREDHPDVWLKAFADIVVVCGQRALCGDFKTGNSRWADIDQLDLYALCIFQHFPRVQNVRGILLFIKDDKPIVKDFNRDEIDAHWLKWLDRIAKIKRARDLHVWPTKPSGLCKYCAHTRCIEHPSWRF